MINLKTLNPPDWVTLILCVICSSLIFLRTPVLGLDLALTYGTAYLAVLSFVVFVIPWIDRTDHFITRNPVTQFVRYLYPGLLLGIFFNWTQPVSHMFFSKPLDPYVLNLDMSLFGYNLGKDLVHMLGDNYWLSEFMSFSYLSYYLTPWLVIYFYFRKQKKEFEYTAFISTLVIFSCFLFQSVLPVEGPIYNDPSIAGHVEAGPISAAAASFLADADVPGSAMPSGHVAGTMVIFFLTWIFYRKAFWITAPLWLSLCLATVYGHFHYAVDGLAGAALAAVCTFWIGPMLYVRFFPDRVPDIIAQKYKGQQTNPAEIPDGAVQQTSNH